MLGEASPFPWWLWLLAALWSASLLLRTRLGPASDWKHSIHILIAVYTALLIYIAVRGSYTSREAIVPDDWAKIGFWACSVLALGGGLIAFCAVRCRVSRWGQAACCLGLSGLAMWLGAYELAVLCCGAGGLGLVTATTEVESAVTERDGWVVCVAATLVCVLWLGLVQYASRVETQRPGPSRWFTAIPEVVAAAKWREASQAPSSEAPGPWLWGTLVVAAVFVWMQLRHTATATGPSGTDANTRDATVVTLAQAHQSGIDQ